MKLIVFLLCACIACFLIAAPPVGQQQAAAEGSSGCALVQKALADSQHVRPGLKRKEVEGYFTPDGGVQSPPDTRYRYRGCDCIKLDVQYKASPAARGNPFATSPDDVVRSVSKLYIEYPITD